MFQQLTNLLIVVTAVLVLAVVVTGIPEPRLKKIPLPAAAVPAGTARTIHEKGNPNP